MKQVSVGRKIRGGEGIVRGGRVGKSWNERKGEKGEQEEGGSGKGKRKGRKNTWRCESKATGSEKSVNEEVG